MQRNQVRSQQFGALAAGSNNLTWTGNNDAGVAQAPGNYTLTVSATTFPAIRSVTQQASGLVTGVTSRMDRQLMINNNTPVSLSTSFQFSVNSTQ